MIASVAYFLGGHPLAAAVAAIIAAAFWVNDPDALERQAA